jgi:hypothetical protein
LPNSARVSQGTATPVIATHTPYERAVDTSAFPGANTLDWLGIFASGNLLKPAGAYSMGVNSIPGFQPATTGYSSDKPGQHQASQGTPQQASMYNGAIGYYKGNIENSKNAPEGAKALVAKL